MSAIVSGNTLGLISTSLNTLGTPGAIGQAGFGNGGEAVYVNIANRNLVVQRQDELLVGRGPDVEVLRTYNSQGVSDGDNNDNWRIGFYRQVKNLVGTLNASGSSVVRVDADGAERTYHYDAAIGKYRTRDGGGSDETLRFDSASQYWTWTEGDSRVTELFDWIAGSGKLLEQSDSAGNSIDYLRPARQPLCQHRCRRLCNARTS